MVQSEPGAESSAITAPFVIREMTACLGPRLAVSLLLVRLCYVAAHSAARLTTVALQDSPELCQMCHDLNLDAAFYRFKSSLCFVRTD